MNKKITSSVLVALMIIGSTSFSAFAAMPTGSVVIGTEAFDLTYANNSANASEISAAVAGGGSVYVKDFNGDWIDNLSGSKVAASLIPAVTYKNASGTSNFAASDTDINTVVTSATVSAIAANQLKETFNGKVADTSKVAFTVKRGTTPMTMVTTWNDAKTEATMTYEDNLPEDIYTVGVMNDTTDMGSSTVAVTKQKVDKIEIVGDTLAVDPPTTDANGGLMPGKGHVSYNIFDQYGVDITDNSLASNINWNSSIGTISASKGLITVSAKDVGLLTQYATTSITATDTDSNISKIITLKVVGKVNALEVTSVNKINDTKNIGDDYTLPTTVTAVLSDKTTKDFAVTWNKVARTKVVGQFTFTGTLTMVDGMVNTKDITALTTLTVIKAISDKTDITSKFTDKNFKHYVYLLIGKTSPSPILYSDVKNIKDFDIASLNLGDGLQMSNLNGIEYFTALNSLECGRLELPILDVSKNIALTSLDCSNNFQLKTLDVSKNTALTSLDCYDNQIKTLDVSKNASLTSLDCSGNLLTNLNVNTALTFLDCQNNKLTALDVSKNVALPNLQCSYNQLSTLNINPSLTTLDCSFNKLPALDVSKNTALTSIICSGNQLTTVDTSKNSVLTTLDCSSNQITDLDVSKNIALTSLECYSNQLADLDVSKNTTLYGLGCSFNLLTTLDISKNTALRNLGCSSNQLTNLDVSKSILLYSLSCDSNKLSNLDISKNTALISLVCQYNLLTTLDVSKNVALTSANCANNKLTTLDVSSITGLIGLSCFNNELKTLYANKDMKDDSNWNYKFQYTDSRHIQTAESLVLTIKG